MAQPPVYQKTVNFTQVGSVTPNALDVELANVATSLNAASTNLGLIQRDDGKLRDGLVDVATLSATALQQLQGVVGASATAANASATASANSATVSATNATAAAASATAAGNSATAAAASAAYLNSLVRVNGSVISANLTIPTTSNALSVGPITVPAGVNAIVPANSNWRIL